MSEPAPPLPRVATLGLSVLTIAVVGVLSLALFWGDIVDDDPADEADAGESAVVGGDDFDRADVAGLADDDHAWTEVSGSWLVQDGHAAISTGVEGPVAGLAVLPSDVAAPHLEVTATSVEPGWGFAFRVHGPDDLWAVVARPDRGTWSLLQLAAGVATETEDFLAVEPADGSVLVVDLIGDLIRVTVDGTTTNEVNDPSGAEAGDVGLLALPPGVLPSMAWDGLVVSGS